MADVTYITVDRDMVDLICHRHYGYTSGVTEDVLAANPGLAGLGPVLDAGVEIVLPELTTPSSGFGSIPDDPTTTIKLWD